ncbi:M20 family metallopeptidase [Staphylococcus warneri]|uniref:M20 family metallopeptidase n=1 Tax=Staphylococcus warneri TaxID=1292 RepID=UPI0024802554|nr:M20 family metallopeptidase [Staphylococcus warneri]MDH8805443.1 M20 family metallopeptidase [Staphylococcus warneri]MDH8808026.1 M20 family metallopeptidase [Staphylococcus warneri]MDH8838912.1 M20 family metallopeptidase [Staphylococcus warneri]MDH8843556.1 M20 family metallopeptidase [Staphylococcus warneri]MDH8848545.1 M20 family metallopeptidase [Staphylococcus warneri]
MSNTLVERLREKEDRMIEIRRYLHQHPELSFKEVETPKYIANFYKDKDCKVETNVGQNGVKVTIDSGKPGKTLAIRADFDALPIKEETGLPFASENEGVMHACGHDAHTAYMLILAETLIEMKDQFKGKVIVIHQPAEEMPPGGAQGMIKDGVLEGVDHVLGAHVMSTMEAGKVFYKEGFVQTGRAYFKLTVHGKGGHGSSPHMANDAIVAGANFVITAQTVVSRRLSPFETGVVTIGSFDGKGQFNVIKDSIEIEGDVRALTDDTRDTIEKELTRLVEGLESTFGVTCDFEFNKDYPALYNNPEFTSYVADTIKNAGDNDIKGVEECEPQPPSEDFAFYAVEIPSTFIYSGAAPEDGEIYPHHHPKFNISESSMLVAAEAVGTVVLDYLN